MEGQRDNMGKVWQFVALTVGMLLLVGMVPQKALGRLGLKGVDLFSDLYPQHTGELVTDSIEQLLAEHTTKAAFVDTCRTGMTCIDDFSDESERGMTPFYNALERVEKAGGTARVAVFGDSFIEGDIFTSDLRNLLQQRFGGCGVGFVSITSISSGFRPTVRHLAQGWSSHMVTDTASFDRRLQGINNGYFIPRGDAYIELRGQSKYASHLDSCEVSSLFCVTKQPQAVTSVVNGQKKQQHTTQAEAQLQVLNVEGRIGRVRWSVPPAAGTATYYGVAMDGKRGVAVDNFSVRGSSGLSLKTIPAETLKQFAKLRPYDLIILEYGLNVATKHGKDYGYYKKGMKPVVELLKECFPKAGILIIGVPDRDYKDSQGEMSTMTGIKNLNATQKLIAAENAVAYWNLQEAMGGEGSMAKMARAKPAMANYDFTHINLAGGKHLAKIFFETLMYGKQQHEKRKESLHR